MSSHQMKDMSTTGMEEIGRPTSKELDDANLARMGKRPVLKVSAWCLIWPRNGLTGNSGTLALMSMLGFSCTILITWEGIVVLIPSSGGPAGAVYGFLFVWFGVASTFAVLSELASMAPTSGGQYHWCSMLAPPSAMKILSYLTGWLTVIGWQATYATSCYLCGSLIQGLIVLTNSDYKPHNWHGTLLFWAVALFSITINAVGGKLLPRFEGFILILHILGFFAILIPLTYMADHGSAKEVFTHFLNQGMFPSGGLSFFVGMVGCIFAFAGGDAAVHMSEEISNASIAVPTSIMLSVLINGSLGFGMLLAMLFCLGNNFAESMDSKTGYPFMAIFLDATHSVVGTAVMASIITTMGICTSVGMLASASRQFWSFARDRGIPGWRLWSQVHGTTAVPIYSVLLTTCVVCLLALINIGSEVAFNDLVAMSISGLYLSYMMVAGLLLYRRCTGGISNARSSETAVINTVGGKLVRVRSTARVVGTFGTIILSLIYYLFRARKVYDGPIIETD
ncbi:choline transport protein [Penicillium capsulatum]|uniref:Choline transport protein n=1 Tax=Penicillium capsulatum TaxID=69766 RepID=A0A9W9LFB9_9EURO|nr:choline transport protein [Penicillium capsulatum]